MATPDEPAARERLVRFRRWGRTFFIVVGIFAAVVATVVLLGVADTSALIVGILVLAVSLSLGLSYVLADGLGRGLVWVDHATVMACAVLLTFGILRTALALLGGTIEIPIDAIGSAMVLSARPAALEPLPPTDRWRVTTVVAVATIVAIGGLLQRVP